MIEALTMMSDVPQSITDGRNPIQGDAFVSIATLAAAILAAIIAGWTAYATNRANQQLLQLQLGHEKESRKHQLLREKSKTCMWLCRIGLPALTLTSSIISGHEVEHLPLRGYGVIP